MRTPLLVGLSGVLVATAFWSCVVESDVTSAGGSSAGGSGGSGGAGGAGGSAGSGVGTTGGNTTALPDSGPIIHCTIPGGGATGGATSDDPYLQCTQKLVLIGEHMSAFLPKLGVAESWDSTTLAPDTDAQGQVLHVAGDDAAYAASIARYLVCAEYYGDTQITAEVAKDLIAVQPILVAELKNGDALPISYAGEFYFDLRAAAGGLRGVNVSQAGLANPLDKTIADLYARAIYDNYFVTVPAGDAGVGGAVLGVQQSGGGVAYSVGDAATGAYALADLAVTHSVDDPIAAGIWQEASASIFVYLASRARDPVTGLFYASLVTSADPDHDALAPAASAGPPPDALLTDDNARVILALERTQALVKMNPGLLPTLEATPLQPLADQIIDGLDLPGTVDGGGGTGLWDAMLGGYFTGWAPSTSTLLTDKPLRGNALMLAALERNTVNGGTAPAAGRVVTLTTLLSSMAMDNVSFLTVIGSQSSFFQDTSATFTLSTTPTSTNPRPTSYFAAANAVAIEAMNELLYGLPFGVAP